MAHGYGDAAIGQPGKRAGDESFFDKLPPANNPEHTKPDKSGNDRQELRENLS